jgi:galactitol-specific phosphotransferase system IIB component
MFSMKSVMLKNKVKNYLKKRENRRKMENIQVSLIVYILLITVDMLRMLIKK